MTDSVNVGTGALVQAGMNNRRELVIKLLDGEYVDVSDFAGKPGAIGFGIERNVNIAHQIELEIDTLGRALQVEADADKREILRGEIETLAFLLTQIDHTPVDVITIDNVKVDTGDVNIFTKSLTGNGTIRAFSDLIIDIDNQSSAALRVNDLEVASTRSGHIRLNGKRLNTGNYGALNIEGGGGQRRITVVSEPADVSAKPDIYLDGRIINRLGEITVGSTGSIIIGGDIEGKTVELLAQNAIIQRYKPGFTHIGGLPYVSGSSGSMIAGGSVFLAGQYLNINGTVQGGIPVRSLDLGAGAGTLLDQYDAVYAAYEAGLLSEDALFHNAAGWGAQALELGHDLLDGAEAAAVVRLNSFLDNGQPIVAAYNLATREIEVQNTVVGGGLVTLFGHIISTGNGQIKVTDGYGDLTVNNAVDRAIVLHGLDTGQGIQGKVKIVDAAYRDASDPSLLAQVTEITRNEDGQVVTTVYERREEFIDGEWKVVFGTPTVDTSTDVSRDSAYDPKENQTYSYIRQSAERAPECEKVNETCSLSGSGNSIWAGVFSWLGLVLPGLPGSSTTMNASHTVGVEFVGKEIGSISVDSFGDIFVAGNIINSTGETRIVSQTGDIMRRGEAVISAAHLTLLAQNGAIGAQEDANGLSIRLIGDDGLLDRAIAANGVTLQETMGTLRFHEIGGGAGDVRVSAVENIVGVDKGAGDANLVSGRAITLTAGDGSIGVDAANRVNVDTVDTDEGIFNAFAEHGSVFIEEVAGDLRIERIRADADVGLVDLRVMDGNVLDKNTLLEDSGLTDAQKIQFWLEAGLINIDGDPDGQAASESLATAITAIKEQASRAFDEYWTARGLSAQEVEDGPDSFHTVYSFNAYDPGYSFTFSAQEVADMRAEGVSAAGIAEMEAARTASYHETHAFILEKGGDPNSYDADFFEDNYSLAQGVLANLQEGHLWEVDELMGSINQALFSDREDTEPFIEDPNIVAGALKISTSGNIGELRGVEVFELDPEAGIKPADQERFYDALIQAERDDIIYVYEREGLRYEFVGDQQADGNLVAIRVEIKEDLDADIMGNVDIVSGGNIFLGSENADINVFSATSLDAEGVVRLKSAQGLTNAQTDGNVAAVTGYNVVLEAAGQSVGSPDNRLTLDAEILTARAADSIFVKQLAAAGDLKLDFVRAGNIADILVAGGAMLDRRNDFMTNVRARIINLDALSIGEAGLGRGIGIGQLGVAGDARFNAVARQGSIYIEGTEENIVLGQVEAEGDQPGTVVSIDVLAGALLKGKNTGLNIVAEGKGVTTILKATRGIGVLNAPIDVSVDRIDLLNTLSGGIHVREFNDLLVVNALNRAAGARIGISANDHLTIAPNGSIVSTNGAISLVAAADGTGGDLTHRSGRGRIDAGTGSLFARGENILLENPVIAGAMQFQTVRNGGSMTFADLNIGALGLFTGGRITIGQITHTGGPELLHLGFTDHSRPVADLVLGSVKSNFGVLFDPFRVQRATIGAETARVFMPSAFVGETMTLTTNQTTVVVNQLSPAIQTTGIQFHQVPNKPFMFDIDGTEFRTSGQLIKFDRRNLTAIMTDMLPATQFTHTVFDITELLATGSLLGMFRMFDFDDLLRLNDLRLRDPILGTTAGGTAGEAGAGQDAEQEQAAEEGQEEEPVIVGEQGEQQTAFLCSDNPVSGFVSLNGACGG